MEEKMNFMTKTASRLVVGVAALVSVIGSSFAADSELTIFDWGGFEDTSFFQKYVEKHDVPTYSFYSDEEEAFQKIRAGFRADLAHPCSQSVVKWRKAGIIEPIDTARLSNWDKVIPQFANMEGFQTDGVQWVVPMDWGSTGLTYRTDMVSTADASTLQSFANPKFEGRISLVDNVDDAYALGFLANGVTDWNKASEQDFQNASAFLRKVHKNVRTYWSDGADIRALMASGEIQLSWSWNDVSSILQSEGVPVAMNRKTNEGASTWVCGYVILKDGTGSKDKAYEFLNAWLEDSSAEYLVTEWGYGHTNGDVMERIGDENGFGTLESHLKNTLWQAPLNPELRERMTKEFELIKAGF
jgi:spermidine/putrescine-binding protein